MLMEHGDIIEPQMRLLVAELTPFIEGKPDEVSEKAMNFKMWIF